MLDFGTYPTPVACLEQLSTANATLWVKRDDLTNPVYGGTKVRKLEPLLEDAKSRGATRLITLGALGSHHVLATGVFGKLASFEVEAIALPRPQSRHVLETVRASLAQGVSFVPATSYAEARRHLAARAAEGAYLIPTGGSNTIGTRGLLAAAAELAQQVSLGSLPEPDLLVVALGSGGTAAGLAAGLERAGLRTRVLAVCVAEPQDLFVSWARSLAQELVQPAARAAVGTRLEIERRYLGAGYGRSTAAGERAMNQAEQCGLALDDTYTAKAFAAALDRIALGRERNILFWHTLSSANMATLLMGAPEEQELPIGLLRLAHV